MKTLLKEIKTKNKRVAKLQIRDCAPFAPRPWEVRTTTLMFYCIYIAYSLLSFVFWYIFIVFIFIFVEYESLNILQVVCRKFVSG